jgi:ABC-type Co2+ transport system permease subunit
MKTIATANTRTASKSSVSRLLMATSKASLATCAALAIAGLVGVFSASDAQAFSCGRNAFGAGCSGYRGAVGFNRHGAVAVGRYGNVYAYHRGSGCYWRNAQRICF